MGEHGVKNGDEPTRRGPWVVILTSHLPYHASAAWLIDEGDRSEAVARDFARFVTSEIDPAVAMRLRSPVEELLSWRLTELNPDDYVPGADDLFERYAVARGTDGPGDGD
jgi:hypothetical protein